MSASTLGRSDFTVRTAGAVERAGSPTDQHKRQNPRQDRRDRNPPNPKRRHIYDLLFDEIDRIPSLNDRQKDRLKGNLRDRLTAHAAARPPPSSPPPADHDGEALAEELLRNPDSVPLDPDHVVEFAAPTGPPHAPLDRAMENLILAAQLRECLSRHTETARRVAVYLHLLLTIDGALRPHTIMDV